MNAVPELAIRWEWEAAPSVKAPEHRATWARIEIAVGAEHVTLVEDQESGSSRRSIYCPLYPLAEWAAYNWWLLRADARPARSLDLWGLEHYDSRQFRRHSLRGIGDGFLWPNLALIPEGEHKRLIWQRDRFPTSGRPIRFLADGEAFVDRDSVDRELVSVISAVLTRLAEQGVTDTPLEKEWAEIQRADPDEVEFCLAAARLGLDPYSEAEPYQQLIMRAAAELRGDLLGDFLDAVEPARIGQALEWIRGARAEIEQAPEAEAARTLREELRRSRAAPGNWSWEKGWNQARVVRRILGLADQDVFDLSTYVNSIDRPTADRGLQAVGGSTGGSGPLAVVEPGRPGASRRFTLSRALWHYLWESEPLFLVTTAYTERQKVERAFAAELLAPAQGIGELLSVPPEIAIQDDLDGIAAHFQVSPMVIKHQLDNQLLPI
ncbi:ImmA/IrrE family metallo-endopeptidase [Nonomuraea sp. CA-143628]|uniref:ImmA/IrrE family metallo-endopeptidase n=1 Tax=Nonomuraea sp. CA-143628 TaxID=3239997 RepID=UPI003D927159